MKRALSLILALVMCLGLCACGSATIKNNETVTAGSYSFAVTKTEFVDQYYNGNFYEYVADGDVHFVVETKFNNVGKTETRIPHGFMTLEYGDGYTFQPTDQYHYSFSTGGFVNNADELPLMGQDKPCIVYFDVPAAVEQNTSEPLKLVIKIAGQEFEYIVREGK